MAVTTDIVGGTDATPDPAATKGDPPARARARWPTVAAAVALVALAASPVVVAALSRIGDTWIPMGDWASLAYRTSRVGTADTPLIGAYTVKGWAHPGPLLFWLAAPLWRITGGDARALEWTAALVNIAAIAALAAVAWRRGRWALLLGVLGLVVVLVRTFGPDLLINLWNPYVPLLPFLLVILLVWDAALGRRRALVEAAVPACFAMQCHLAFVPLVALLAVWLWAWSRWWPRLLPQNDEATADLPRPPWSRWWRTVRWGVGVVALLSVGPLLDAVLDMHNPGRIIHSFGSDTVRLGLVDAVGIVGRHVRPDGPWLGGPEPTHGLSVVGSGALPVLLALAALAACLHVARRRGLVDVAALACLSLTLVLGSLPATTQLIVPVERYLTEWLKIVGGLVWFTVGWTLWRLAEPAVRSLPRRRVAAAAAAALVLAGAAWSWPAATRVEPQFADQGAITAALAAEVAAQLPRDEIIRVERRGEPWHIYAPAVIQQLIERGVQVTTSDGRWGLKWGHEHRWMPREHYDRLLTVAVHLPGSWYDAVARCEEVEIVDKLAEYDALSPEDRAWLEDAQLRRFSDPDSVSADEIARADALGAEGLRIAVFEGPVLCARDQSHISDEDRTG